MHLKQINVKKCYKRHLTHLELLQDNRNSDITLTTCIRKSATKTQYYCK